MAETITIREYTAEDRAGVLELLRLSLGETPLLRRTPQLFEWKHISNPFGTSIMLVAEANGRIVGFRAFMRWELVTPSSDIITCVRPVDTATHPDFQRRGIFRQLTMQAVEVARSDGVQLIFNTPNPRSGAGYTSMGWSEVGGVGVLARPSFRLFTGREGSMTNTVDEKDPDWESVEAATRAPRGLRTPRSPDYLRWRFGSHPTARYSLIEEDGGTVIVRPNLRKGRRELIVSELFGSNGRRAITHGRQRIRPHYTVASFASGTPERATAMRAGMLPVPGARALTLYARPVDDLELDPATLESWDLTLGDLELL